MASLIIDRDLPLVHIPPRATTWSGFRKWATSDAFPESVRATFLAGEILLDMSPEDLGHHNQIKTAITSAIFQMTRAQKLGVVFSDGTLVSHSGAALSTEPDMTFVRWESFRSRRVTLTQRKDRPGEYRELKGTPDIVLEVISRSSINKDTKRLRNAYHLAGVPEYWLVDPLAARVSFALLQWRKNGYVLAPPRSGWYRSDVLHHDVRLARKRNSVGMWDYTLLVREAPAEGKE